MIYYRRKILLALLQAFGGQLGKTDLQKLLLILTKLQKKPSFEFVPHRFGCYSFQSNWDLKALKTYGIIEESENGWNILKEENYVGMINDDDKSHLNYVSKRYKNYELEKLIKETYISYPYYAIKSEKAINILTKEELAKVVDYIPKKEGISLFTIGYEGITIESYFNKLITNNVSILCDVRRNALSQKFGFSKNILSKVCESLGITYVHIPNLGIASDKRQNLKTQKDYDILFEEYENQHLINQTSSLYSILDLLQNYKRVALTCFEASYCQCHRSKVAKAMTELPEWKYKLQHL